MCRNWCRDSNKLGDYEKLFLNQVLTYTQRELVGLDPKDKCAWSYEIIPCMQKQDAI